MEAKRLSPSQFLRLIDISLNFQWMLDFQSLSPVLWNRIAWAAEPGGLGGCSPPVFAKFSQNLPFLPQILAFLCLQSPHVPVSPRTFKFTPPSMNRLGVSLSINNQFLPTKMPEFIGLSGISLPCDKNIRAFYLSSIWNGIKNLHSFIIYRGMHTFLLKHVEMQTFTSLCKDIRNGVVALIT